jgi:hypothetical protein
MPKGSAVEFTLYVVPMEGGAQLDSATAAVADVFARRGFAIAVHRGTISVAEVLDGVRRSGALSVLLSRGGRDSEIRLLTRAMRDDVVDQVMSVIETPPESREGDRGVPFPIHPTEGEERMVWLADLVWRDLLGSGAARS